MVDPTGDPVRSDGPTIVSKIAEKIHGHGSSSDSSFDSDENHSRVSDAESGVYRLFGREKPIHEALGGGKYADLLLWRRKNPSFLMVCGATVVWITFENLGYSVVTIISHVIMSALAFFFLWSNSCNLINKPRPKIPDIQFNDQCVLEVASVVRTLMNHGLTVARNAAAGSDLGKFLKAIIVLWVISLVTSWFDFFTLLYT